MSRPWKGRRPRWRHVVVALAAAFSVLVVPSGRAAAQEADCADHFVTAWSAAMDWPDRSFPDATLRMPFRPLWGGDTIRLRFSNELGADPATLRSIRLARRGAGPTIVAGSQVPITFEGDDAVVIPAGGEAVSDEIAFSYQRVEELVATFYSDPSNTTATGHQWAAQVTYVGYGVNMTESEGLDVVWAEETSWFYLSGMDVVAPGEVSNLVLYGDSITEGFQSTHELHHRYPDFLAERMAEAGLPLAAVNEGLSGNRVTHDGVANFGGGLNAVDRFTRDVGSVADPTAVVVLVGINDIGHPSLVFEPEAAVTADEIIAGLSEIARTAKRMGLTVYGGTLTPAGDVTQPSPLGYYSTPESNGKRNAVNEWVRTTDLFDGVMDFDRVIADPLFPEHMQAQFNAGDNLHPNDAGYEAMAASFDLPSLPVRACGTNSPAPAPAATGSPKSAAAVSVAGNRFGASIPATGGNAPSAAILVATVVGLTGLRARRRMTGGTS